MMPEGLLQKLALVAEYLADLFGSGKPDAKWRGGTFTLTFLTPKLRAQLTVTPL